MAMPFHDIHMPNISMGILKSVLNNSGFICDIYYANLEFAVLIGRDLYNFFQKSMPLIGDYLFSDVLYDNDRNFEQSGSYNSLNNKEKRAFNIAKKYAREFVDRIAHKIAKKKYDIVGFSLIFQTIPSLTLAKKLKKLVPAVKIVCGGANCVGDMGLGLHQNFEWVDFVCRGEGEKLVIELIETISKKSENFETIKGLIWRKDGISIANGSKTDYLSDINSVPTPDYSDWWQQVEEHGLYYASSEWAIPFESSRGCWYGFSNHCIFCGLGGDDLRSRVKSDEKVISELKQLSSKFPIKNMTAIDLIFPNQYFKEFLSKLAKEDLDIIVNYEIKANISRKQLSQFRNAGVLNLQPGIESLSSSILKTMNKGSKSFVNIRLLKWTFGLGINLIWNFVYGIPGEKKSEYKKMAMLIREISHLQPPVIGCLPVGLVRNSPLFEKQDKFGVTNVKPMNSYYEIYDLPDSEIEKISILL